MKELKLTILLLIASIVISYAQSQGNQNPPASQQNNSELQAGNSQNKGTDGAADTTATGNTDDSGGQSSANAPAVVQTTSSDSGSPAVLSRNDGRGRDGTNNVQRASMNMVGSPAINLGLDQVRAEDPDSEMVDRQAYTQESARDQDEGADSPDNKAPDPKD